VSDRVHPGGGGQVAAPSVVGYCRVSTREQADEGVGLDAQRAAIEAACRARGWQLVAVEEDRGVSGRALGNRPGLHAALAAAEGRNRRAEVVMAAKLDRLTRNVHDFTGLVQRAARRRWALVLLDVDVDTSTPEGHLHAVTMASFAEFERRRLGQRVREALAIRRAQGVRLGAAPSVTADAVTRVLELHRAGLSQRSIAARLTADGVPTPLGRSSTWQRSTVVNILRREGAAAPT
jgi:DNA invertase Pin-like site-specific DNA recombinase